MSIRSIWVISLSSDKKGDAVFSRKYNSVETRAKKLYGDDYHRIPDNQTLIQCLLAEFGFMPESKKFQKQRDACNKLVQVPVIELKTAIGFLWPVLVIEQSGYLYCCLPLVEDSSMLKGKKLLDIPSIAVGFSLLMGIAEFCTSSLSGHTSEINERLSELGNILIISMPFGTPTETDILSVQPLLLSKQLAVSKTNQKQPMWRSTIFKGKSSIQVTITEFVRSIQHETRSVSHDETSLYGSLSCLSQFNGSTVQNVNMAVKHSDHDSRLVLDDVVVHAAVEPSESGLGILTEHGTSYRLKFTPPLHRLKLLSFTAPTDSGPPIYGIYQMQGIKKVDLLLQLKLNSQLKNSFEFFDATLPFFHRGRISFVDCKPTSGSVRVSDDRRTLVWNLGQKFPSRTASVSLTATVHFIDLDTNENVIEDSFCVGMTAYASINFKMNDFTLSGCHVDQKYVQTTPNTKFKFTCNTELVSAEYKIWNCYGDSPLVV
ncbi:AP-5 complex subunit mu-1 [Nymphon striatum]|nr:AP-5 complex subunit mu-1 [Nymphon striatum]